MAGPPPKTSGTRARRNKTSTAATIKADSQIEAPTLPGSEWHPMTQAWWTDIWASPMAPEYDTSDRHGLFVLARLVDAFWMCDSPTMAKDLAAEIRQQGQRFGLSPIDRRRLQWEIERTEDAQEKGAKRRSATPAPAPAGKKKDGGDPRSVLRAV